jgi:hypothetical protein
MLKENQTKILIIVQEINFKNFSSKKGCHSFLKFFCIFVDSCRSKTQGTFSCADEGFGIVIALSMPMGITVVFLALAPIAAAIGVAYFDEW